MHTPLLPPQNCLQDQTTQVTSQNNHRNSQPHIRIQANFILTSFSSIVQDQFEDLSKIYRFFTSMLTWQSTFLKCACPVNFHS